MEKNKVEKKSSKTPIYGKIARIVDESYFILNVGWNKDVANGMRFVIYQESDDEIRDVDTAEMLGRIEFLKGTIEVFHVQEFISHARPYKPKTDTTAKALEALLPNRPVEPYEDEMFTKLDVRVSEISGRPHMKPISVGDLVRSINREGS